MVLPSTISVPRNHLIASKRLLRVLVRIVAQETVNSAHQNEETMKRNQLFTAVGIVLFAVSSLAAQDAKPGTLVSIEFQ